MGQRALSSARRSAGVDAGKLDALAEMVHRHQQSVLTLTERILGDWTAAQEVAIATFLHVLQGADQPAGPGDRLAWLYRIAVNLCFDQQRRLSADLTGGGPEGVVTPGSVGERVREAVRRLPVRQRTMLVLGRYHGLNVRRIAYVTCCSTSAVRSLTSRAYAALTGADASHEPDEVPSPAATPAGDEHVSESTLIEIASGQVEGEDKDGAAEHLALCSPCLRKLEGFRQTWEWLGAWEVDAEGRDVWAAVQRAAGGRTGRWGWVWRLLRRVALTGIVLGLLAGAWAVVRWGPSLLDRLRSVTPPPPQTPPATKPQDH